MKTAKQKRIDLREMLNSKELTFVMEAHDGASSKIVEEAGFKAIWASGLSVSTALGYRDNNELSFSQVADHCYYMARCTNIPVIVDCDTMYGDFNTARTALQLFERAGVAGLIIEDKVFPKKNSFLNNGKKALANPMEFALKIRAIQDSKIDPNMVVVARVESFLVGNDVDDAIMRANLYVDEGHADAVLIHSKKPTSEDIDAFMERWNNKAPVFIVPTKYYKVPSDHFREIGINTVIWANHNMRTAITAMRETTKNIFETESLMGVEDKIISVSDVFKFQGNDELSEAEKKYLPKSASTAQAIILGASKVKGTELNKTEIIVGKKDVLHHQIDAFKYYGIGDIIAVVPEGCSSNPDITTYQSTTYKGTTELDSLKLVKDKLKSNSIISYGDLIYRRYIIQELLDSTDDVTLVVNRIIFSTSSHNEYVNAVENFNELTCEKSEKVTSVSTKIDYDNSSTPISLFIGLMSIKNPLVVDSINKYLESCDTSKNHMCDLINHLIEKGFTVGTRYIDLSSYVDVNEYADVEKANTIK